MKKRLLIIFTILLVVGDGLAQDPNPDLFQTWHLYEIDFESGQTIIVANFNPPIAPTLTIDPSLAFNGVGVCNTFEGFFTYTAPSDFEVANESHTTNSCNFDGTMFENEYFGFFAEGTYLFTTIETDTDGFQSLYMTGGIFTTLTFRNTPVLATPEFSQPKIKMYPNPASDLLFVTSEGITIGKIKLYSMSGNQVKKVSANVKFIDVSGLSAGLYFLEISSSEGKIVQKFVKQ